MYPNEFDTRRECMCVCFWYIKMKILGMKKKIQSNYHGVLKYFINLLTLLSSFLG